jgi:hypothetical protein
MTLLSMLSCKGLNLHHLDPTFSLLELLHMTLLFRFFYGGPDLNLSFSFLELLLP